MVETVLLELREILVNLQGFNYKAGSLTMNLKAYVKDAVICFSEV